MARPKGTTTLELAPEIQTRIATYILAGSYIETAAKAAGIHKDTLYDWLKRGATGEEPFASFSDAVERALGEAEIRDLAVVSKAAQAGVWQAAAWKLERRNPKAWGRRIAAEVSGPDRGPIELDAADAREQLMAKLQATHERIVADAAGSSLGAPDAKDVRRARENRDLMLTAE